MKKPGWIESLIVVEWWITVPAIWLLSSKFSFLVFDMDVLLMSPIETYLASAPGGGAQSIRH
jgi:hypothetical protein